MTQSPAAATAEPGKLYRWLVLFWLSITMFGNYYFYDALEPLADVLQRQLHFTDQNIVDRFSVSGVRGDLDLTRRTGW